MKKLIPIVIGYTLVIGAILAWHYWHINGSLTGAVTVAGLIIISVSALDLLE